MISALSQNMVIGKDNTLPRHYPEDFKHFKRMTIHKPIVMGRKTFESIGKPLPKRKNIVLTRDKQWTFPGVDITDDYIALINTYIYSQDAELMVIGGEQIYRLFLPFATTLYLTEVKKHVEGDTFFPAYEGFTELERITHDEFDFVTYSNFTSLDSTTNETIPRPFKKN